MAIEELVNFVHGSTVAINTVIERKGASTALIVTRGTRDLYSIGRGNRPEAYNIYFKRPEPLVPRELTFEADERLLASGEVTSEPGYYPVGSILYAYGGTVFPPVPDHPDEQDVDKAVATLREPLRDFPWMSDADESVALSAILSILARPAILGPVPLHVFRAPTPGTGKSLVANVVAGITTGRVAPVTPPTVIEVSTLTVGSPWLTGTDCPSLPQVQPPTEILRSFPTRETFSNAFGPFPIKLTSLMGEVSFPPSIM